MKKRTFVFTLLASLFIMMFPFRRHFASQQENVLQEQARDSFERLSGLQQRVTVVRDKFGVPHVTATSDHDAYFMMGYLHAQDRFFEMDLARRSGSGTSAELLGAGPGDNILIEDAFQRVVGTRRAAERSLSAYSPQAMALIQAYSGGVNAWLDHNSLPPEYAALEITQAPRWTPLDSVTVSKFIQFQLSFDFTDLLNSLAFPAFDFSGQISGFDGARLYFEDILTVAPFDPVVTIPGQAGAAPRSLPGIQSQSLKSQIVERARQAQKMVSPDVMETMRKFIDQHKRTPRFNRSRSGVGSNWWVVSGSKTDTGNTMLANDPHLGLQIPSIHYEIHLTVESNSSPMNVYGVSFPGIPGVVLGQNDSISWGATNSFLDVTDFYNEQCVIDDDRHPVATIYKGNVEPLVVIHESYRVNQILNGVLDDVVAIDPEDRPSGAIISEETRVAPRRNNGALLPGAGPTGAISIQYTGASATRELEGIFAFARARNLDDFKDALQFMETGPLNWAYADTKGNIASFVNGKIPLREDLQAGFVDGAPPFFLRDGTGTMRNEWIPKDDGEPGFGYQSVPFEEMPHAVNPAQGFLVNANNDPLGLTLDNSVVNPTSNGSIYYISSGFNPGFRAAKITNLLERELNSHHGHGKVSFEDMKRIQSNVQMLDAEVLRQYIICAFVTARKAGAPAELAALANDPAVREAVWRLSNWNFSAPTGISEGYDVADIDGTRQRPSANDVFNSVATTIYSVWRGRILANTVVGTLERVGLGPFRPDNGRLLVDLRRLLDNFSINHGIGASGLDFFEVQGIGAPPEVRRDYIILKSLKESLDLLAGDEFADAFGNSTVQNDYRWGKLHRVTFNHIFGPLAPQFSIPTAGNFVDLAPALPGLATDGGFETIDNAPSNGLEASSQAYVFSVGPARRYVSELCRDGVKSVQIIPGGQSGVLGNRFYANQLSLWLTNDYHRVLSTKYEVEREKYSKIVYKPEK